MSETCCSISTPRAGASRCPASGFAGQLVDWTTVAALSGGRVPPRQEFRLCRDPECEVVYYGTAGALLATRDLNVRPGFKNGGDGLLCYCFLHREADIARQLAETGRTDLFRSIRDEVEAGNCACEVRNPSGRCCLGEVQETIHRLEEAMGVHP